MEGEIIVVFEKRQTTNKTAINSKNGKTKTPEEIEKEHIIDMYEARMYLISYTEDTVKNTVKSIVKNEAMYEINKYFDLTDNVQAQRDMNIAMNIASKSIGIIRAGIVGGKIGMAAGPVGGIIGAAVGATAGVVKTLVDIHQGYDQQAINIKQKEAQLEYTRQRAGYSLTAGANGENR